MENLITSTISNYPTVSIIWNFYPLNWFILPPIDWILNILVFPITLLTWPLWWIWNFITLPLAIIFFPLWAIGFGLVLFFSGFGWFALILFQLPLWTFLFIYVLGIVAFSGSPIYVPLLVSVGLIIVLTIAFGIFLIVAFPVGGIISLIIWAATPCINEDAAAECQQERRDTLASTDGVTIWRPGM